MTCLSLPSKSEPTLLLGVPPFQSVSILQSPFTPSSFKKVFRTIFFMVDSFLLPVCLSHHFVFSLFFLSRCLFHFQPLSLSLCDFLIYCFSLFRCFLLSSMLISLPVFHQLLFFLLPFLTISLSFLFFLHFFFYILADLRHKPRSCA